MRVHRVLIDFVVLGAHVGAIWLLCLARTPAPTADTPAIAVTLLQAQERPADASPPTRAEWTLVVPPVPLPLPSTSVTASAEAAVSDLASLAPQPGDAPSPSQPDPPALESGPALELLCPQRDPPLYPALSRREREQGEVRLRVELDESGRIDTVTVVSSSGSRRLDEAARQAVRSWRCRPAERDGHGVRAVAWQTLGFELDRR